MIQVQDIIIRVAVKKNEIWKRGITGYFVAVEVELTVLHDKDFFNFRIGEHLLSTWTNKRSIFLGHLLYGQLSVYLTVWKHHWQVILV